MYQLSNKLFLRWKRQCLYTINLSIMTLFIIKYTVSDLQPSIKISESFVDVPLSEKSCAKTCFAPNPRHRVHRQRIIRAALHCQNMIASPDARPSFWRNYSKVAGYVRHTWNSFDLGREHSVRLHVNTSVITYNLPALITRLLRCCRRIWENRLFFSREISSNTARNTWRYTRTRGPAWKSRRRPRWTRTVIMQQSPWLLSNQEGEGLLRVIVFVFFAFLYA